MPEYAELVVSPRALTDGLILVFQHPVNDLRSLTIFSRIGSNLSESLKFSGRHTKLKSVSQTMTGTG